MGEEFYPKQKWSRAVMREIFDWLEAGIVAVVCVVLLFTFVVRMAGVEGGSMNPTLKDQDRLLITRLFYTPQNGDIVVVTKPNRLGEPLIKRVIATEGQTIDIDFDSGSVYLDGELLSEPYINERTYSSEDMQFPQTIPEGCVFVMGDNRNASWDSRDTQVGMVDQRYILGRVVYRLLPWESMGIPQ